MQGILAFLTALGLGGILGNLLTSYVQRHNEVKRDEHNLKQKRYFCIMSLMRAKLDISHLYKVTAFVPDIRDEASLDEELASELLNSIVFASDDVINSFANFLSKPDLDTFTATAKAIRRDLWGSRSKVSMDSIELLIRSNSVASNVK